MSRHAHRALQLVALGTTAFIASCSDGTAEPAAVPSTLTVEPSSLVLKVNRTQQLTANVRDQHGQTMSSLPGNVELRWSSSDTTRLVVDAITGLARAVRPGASTINATAGAAAGTLSVSILSSIPNSVQINGGATNLRIAETRALVATVFDDEGVAVNPDREGLTVSWSTSDASVVAVTTSGAIRALRPGNATITAQAGSAQASVDFVVLEPQVNLEIATQVSMRVGSAGGVLTTTATNGRKFTLTIPPGSLRDTTELTLVPIASIDNLPVGSTLLGAAHFLPEGLQLNGPATLRITGVPQTNASNATGFTYEGTGAALQRTVLGMRSDTAVVLLTHFSGAGALNVQDASSVPAPDVPNAVTQYFLQLEALSDQGKQSGTFDVQGITEVFQGWYATLVFPAFTGSGNSDVGLQNALFQFGLWYHLALCGSDSCSLQGEGNMHMWPEATGLVIQGNLASSLGGARGLLAAALEEGIGRANAQCITGRNLIAAANVFFWQKRAQHYGIATVANRLDLARVRADLCVKLVILNGTFPESFEPDVPAELRITAGLRFGNGAPVFEPSLLVDVTASGTTSGGSESFTTNGVYTRMYTPTGEHPVRFDVRVSLVDRGLDAEGVYRDTIINRPLNVGVTLTPTAAILDAGAQAAFQATVTGVSNTAVTWTATGGTFTIAGNTLNYTAGGTAGTYSVTARSVANPDKSATARIDIVSETVVYQDDFSGSVDLAWSHPTITTSPNGQRYLGDFQQQTVNLTINELAAHSSLEIEFDFYTISDWEGSASEGAGGTDIITFKGDGQTLLVTTFSTKAGFMQAFPGSYPGALNAPMSGAVATASLGFPGGSGHTGDATYRIRFTVPHTAASFVFSIVGAIDLAGPTGERFGIDNVRVKIMQ